jgi:biopolymer transport protein TolQ
LPAFILDALAQPVSPSGNLSIVSLILQASPLVQLVLLLLVGMSVASWGVIFLKSQTFRRAAQESADIRHEMSGRGGLADLREFVESCEDAPEASLVRAGFDLWAGMGGARGADDLDRVRAALGRAAHRERLRLERYLTMLATTGSASPFIGLFGTVWGIMNTFRSLGLSGSTSLSVVAPGIAEALVAPAGGLAAAIPAVMAYNHYVRRVRVAASEMEIFSSELLDRLQRDAG